MTPKKKIVLPDAQEMLRRLMTVSDEQHYQQKFYPLLLAYAGQPKVASGIVVMFSLAIADYCKGLPPIMSSMLYMDVPDFIDALVDDKEVVTEAKAFLEKAQQAR